MTITKFDDIKRLINFLDKGTREPSRAPLLWAGAGLSIPSGYPSLGQLAEKLRSKSLIPLPKNLAPMETIDAFVKENGKGDLAEALADIFDRKKPLQYHRDLMRLSWKAVITTNYDELLEDALKELDRKFIKVTLGENLDLTARPELALFKIHGDLSGFRSMVLSGQSYADYGQRYALLKQDLESLLRKHHVVYFGCSMTDPRLIDWLESLGRENREQLMSSCAVMTEADWNRIPQETTTLLEEATIKPVFVKDHAQIPELISYLVKTVVGGADRKELKLVIEPAPDSKNQWQVTGFDGNTRLAEVPWKDGYRFADALNSFLHMADAPVSTQEDRQALYSHAVFLGDALAAAVLSEQDQQAITNAGSPDGQPPFVIIESRDEIVLSLPWELMRIEKEFPVCSGRIDLARTCPAVSADPPQLTIPDRHMSLVINVSAPEGGTVGDLDYEAEGYRINKALHEHITVQFTELGTLDDLVETVAAHQPVGFHFSGHGSPGRLLFENDEGLEDPVAIHELVNRIRIEAPEKFPRFVYLASCHGNTPAKPDEQKTGSTITAAQLHKEGVVQVIGYFGPIVDELSTLAEEKIYRALAGGKKTRHAVRKARAALAAGAVELCKSTHRDGAAKDVWDVFPFAWAQLVFYHRGPDHPLSLESPKGFVPQEAGLHREFLEESEIRRQLTTGFIGRRKQLHTFRRQLKNGRRVFVFQGLGGLGKSTLAFKALPMLASQHPALTFWCQELEDDDDQAGALTTRLSDYGQMLFGSQWLDVVQAVDRVSEATRADRFGMFLSALVQNLDHTVLHFENMESLLTGPDNEDPQAFANWKSPDIEAIWHRVKKMASDKLSIVASCRYRNQSFEEDIVHVPEMGPNAIFRLMGWFDGLRRLALPNRIELVSRVHGHPRAVEYLDDLVKDWIRTWESRYGQLPNAATRDAAETQWRDIVAPALPSAERQLVQNLLLDAIWERVLDDPCRNILFRMTVLRRPWDWDLMMELGEPGQEKELTEKTAGRLRGTSLLGELEEKRNNTWIRLFQIHPSTGNFIRAKFDRPQGEKLRVATCLRIGTWLEKRLKKSRNILDGLDAGHYLFEGGEFDRSFDLLGAASDYLQQRGKMREGLLVLAEFEKQETLKHLDPQRAGRLLGILGLAHYRLAEVEKAIGCYEQALAIFRKIGDRRGEGTSLGNLGLAYRALGQVEKAISHYEQALAIAHKIGDRYGEGNHLGNLGSAYYALGQVEKAIGYHEQALVISREIGDRRGEGTSLGNLGLAYRALGQVEKAIGYHEQSLVISREIGDRHGEGSDLGNLGSAYFVLGQVEKAIGYYEQALAIAREIGDRHGEGSRLGNLGNAYLDLGQVERAIGYYEQALAIAREIGDRHGEGSRLGNLGNAYVDLGQVEKAIGYYKQALTISREIGYRYGEGNWLGGLGLAYRNLGQVEKARKFLKEALAIGKEIKDPNIVKISAENLEKLDK